MDRVFRGSWCCGWVIGQFDIWEETTMKKLKPSVIAVMALGAISGAGAQQPSEPQPPQSPNMTFFVTSVGLGKGADLADGKPAVNARDRIGNGPWQNFKDEVVAQNIDDLHSDNNKLGMQTSLTENGRMIPGVGFAPTRHDALTGSQADGRAFPPGEDRTCGNWTSSTQGSAMLGHIDRRG